MGYLFIWKSGYGLVGFGIMKVLIELINLIGLIRIVKMKADPRTIGWET